MTWSGSTIFVGWWRRSWRAFLEELFEDAAILQHRDMRPMRYGDRSVPERVVRLFRSGLALAGMSAFSPRVLACGVCTTAMADAVLPPIYAWAILGPAWMLLTAGLAWWHGAKVPWHPGIRSTIVILLVTAVLAVLPLGLGVGLLLFVPPATALAMATFGSPARFPSVALRRHVRLLGIPALIAVATIAGLSMHLRATRTTGEFIVQWSSTAIGRSLLKRLRDTPDALRDYRHIVEHGRQRPAAYAATQLAAIGNTSDLPRLQQALVRARREQWRETHHA